MTRLTDFTGMPPVAGVQWHHGVVDAVTSRTRLLNDLHALGVVNLGDWRVNGVPVPTGVADATRVVARNTVLVMMRS